MSGECRWYYVLAWGADLEIMSGMNRWRSSVMSLDEDGSGQLLWQQEMRQISGGIIKKGEWKRARLRVLNCPLAVILQDFRWKSGRWFRRFMNCRSYRLPENVRPGERQEYVFLFEKTKLTAEYAIVGTRNSMQQIMLRFEQPLSGIWTVELQADFVLSGNIFCWLPLSQLLSGEVFFLRSDPNTTVTMPGMSRVAITTGAYQAIGGSIDPDSGRGFSSLDAVKPDIVAPGVNVLGPVLRDRYELRSGTSISAALTAGACAQLFQWGIVENNMLYLNTTDLKNLLIRGAVRDEDRTYPNPVYGYGVLEVYQALSRLRGN